jgi:hypothetical protein
MRRTIGAVGATLTATGLFLGATGLVARAATPQTAQANAALRYLYTQVGADGGVSPAFGPGATEDTVISVADSGYDPATLRSPSTGTTTYHYLTAQAASINSAGAAAKYVLTWLAAGKPAAIDATAQLTKLNTPTSAGGYLQANGGFHNGAGGETVYSQSLAVLADLLARVALPPHATGWLTCAQRTDGGFGFVIHDTAATPPSSCGDAVSDTNSTAIVLQALGRAGITSANSAALGYLHTAQHNDGGFGFDAGSPTDPDSDGTVLQALLAIGQDPTGAAWTVGAGGNPLSSMESFADPNTGGYRNAAGAPPDAFTTSTIPQALALKPYGTATAPVAGTSPPPASTNTPSPSPTGTQAVTVPDTGSAGGFGGGALGTLLLLALGSLALTCAGLGRSRRPAP